jgi:hypothetical protein
MAIRATQVVVVFAMVARLAAAQGTASISGIVRDSTNRPLDQADVVAIPAGVHARTDSTGRFAFRGLDNKKYTVRARRVGYVPVEWTVDLSKGGHADVQIVFTARLPMLDTVRVLADRSCSPRSYEGFLCRRATTKGAFLDYDEIDTMSVFYTADLLRDVGGFGTAVVSTRDGLTRIPSTKVCTIVLVNGTQTSWSQVPDLPHMISAIEVYKNPREIPKEFRRFTWGKERCWLVAYWTYDFMMKPLVKQGLRRPYISG